MIKNKMKLKKPIKYEKLIFGRTVIEIHQNKLVRRTYEVTEGKKDGYEVIFRNNIPQKIYHCSSCKKKEVYSVFKKTQDSIIKKPQKHNIKRFKPYIINYEDSFYIGSGDCRDPREDRITRRYASTLYFEAYYHKNSGELVDLMEYVLLPPSGTRRELAGRWSGEIFNTGDYYYKNYLYFKKIKRRKIIIKKIRKKIKKTLKIVEGYGLY